MSASRGMPTTVAASGNRANGRNLFEDSKTVRS